MPGEEDPEVLKAVLAVAAADGTILRSERGVFQQLARRVGLDEASLQQVTRQAGDKRQLRDELFKTRLSDPKRAMRLLVATARIDGEISWEERELLVDISTKLGIGTDEFTQVYQEGIAAADELRKRTGR